VVRTQSEKTHLEVTVMKTHSSVMIARAALVALVAPSVLAATNATCGTCGTANNCTGCEHPDSGSCGNACCRLDWTVVGPGGWTQVAATLNATLALGGPDGAFTPSMLAEGVPGCADLSSFGHSVIICQFHHTTAGPMHYNDSIALTIAPGAAGGAAVRLFSYSLIGGAYGDSGQNRKNLDMVVQAYTAGIGSDHVESSVVNADESCP